MTFKLKIFENSFRHISRRRGFTCPNSAKIGFREVAEKSPGFADRKNLAPRD